METTSLITSGIDISDKQMERLFDLVRGDIQRCDIRGDRLEQILNLAEKLEINKGIVEFLEGKAWRLAKAMPVSVNYDESDALVAAIEQGNFKLHLEGLDFEDIPLGGTGFQKYEVAVQRFPGLTYDLQLQEKLGLFNLQSVDPLTALRYATKHKQFFEIEPIALTFLSKKGDLCNMVVRCAYGLAKRPVRIRLASEKTVTRGLTNFVVRSL